MRSKITYANVVATLALFIAVGGASAFAATQLAKNSVGSKQLKKNAVITPKIKNQAVTGAKIKNGTLTGAQINASTLGTVPTAETANTAKSLSPPEDWHVVGAAGQPTFQNGWGNVPPAGASTETIAFYKDQEGLVRLRGFATGGTADKPIFQLPPGYRPAQGKLLQTPIVCNPCGATNVAASVIFGAGISPEADGAVIGKGTLVGLDGVAFRAEG